MLIFQNLPTVCWLRTVLDRQVIIFFRSPDGQEEEKNTGKSWDRTRVLWLQATNFAQEHTDLYYRLQVFCFVGLVFFSSLTEATLDQSGLYKINW